MMRGYYGVGGVWDTLFPMSEPTSEAVDALAAEAKASAGVVESALKSRAAMETAAVEQKVKEVVQEEGAIAGAKATAKAKAEIEPLAYERAKAGATEATVGVLVTAAVVLGLGYFLFWRR